MDSDLVTRIEIATLFNTTPTLISARIKDPDFPPVAGKKTILTSDGLRPFRSVNAYRLKAVNYYFELYPIKRRGVASPLDLIKEA